jgi:TetR/AcrR family transcriptional repressor of nem operon
MGRPRDFDEAEVIRAARDQFWRTGYAGTSIVDLTTATGLGKGSLYGAFEDKHNLYVRAFDDYCTTAIADIREQLLEDPRPAIERLRAHVMGQVKNVVADKEHRGCMLTKGTAELAGQDPEVTERAQRTFVEYEKILVACVREAQRDEDIDPEADALALAGLLLTVLRGLDALGKAGMSRKFLFRTAETALKALPV